MGISGNMQSLSQLCACYGVPRVTRGFTTLFIGETFAVCGNVAMIFTILRGRLGRDTRLCKR